MCLCLRERERKGERQKYTQIAEGKVTERNKRTERDNKLVEGGLGVCVRECYRMREKRKRHRAEGERDRGS